MPNVPIYSSPTVAPAALPGVRQQTPYRLMQASALGPQQEMQLGQATEKFGGAISNEVTLDQIHTNEAAAKEYDAQHMAAIQGVLAGSDNDPNSGYMNQKGKSAVDSFQATVDKIKGLTTDLDSTLQNQAQRDLVKNIAEMRTTAALAQVKSHQMQQADIYETSASKTRLAVAQDGTALAFNPISDTAKASFDQENPANNSAYQQYLQTIQSEANRIAGKTFGLGDDTKDLRDAYIKDAMAKAYTKTLGQLFSKHGGSPADTEIAKSYFEKVKDELSPEQRKQATDALNAADLQDNQVTVMRALEKMGGIKDQRKALGDAFDNGGSINGVKVNGEIYKFASSAIDHAQAQKEHDEDKYVANAVGQAQDFILKHPGATVLDLPRNLYAALESRGHLAAIDSFANRETNKPTDPNILHDLYAHLGDSSPLDVAKMPDTQWQLLQSKMSRSDWLFWDKQRSDAQNGELPTSKDPGNLNIGNFNQALNNRLLSIDINPTKAKSTEDKEQIGAIQDYAAKFIIGEQQAAGKRFNQKEIQAKLDELFATNVSFRTSFLGIPTGTTSTRMLTLKAKNLPSDAYEGIKQDLIRSGNTNPTDRDILLQYWSLHGRR